MATLGYALAPTAPPTLAGPFFAALTAGSLADALTGGSILAVRLSMIVWDWRGRPWCWPA